MDSHFHCINQKVQKRLCSCPDIGKLISNGNPGSIGGKGIVLNGGESGVILIMTYCPLSTAKSYS